MARSVSKTETVGDFMSSKPNHCGSLIHDEFVTNETRIELNWWLRSVGLFRWFGPNGETDYRHIPSLLPDRSTLFGKTRFRIPSRIHSRAGQGFFVSTLLAACVINGMPAPAWADEASPKSGKAKVVFEEDFESGIERWEVLDPDTWRLRESEGGHSFEITERASAYKPPTRSPGHVALIRDLKVGNCEIRFRVRSTKDTGNHRDCCVFFSYQNSSEFYYVHLGAKPDPHSGQIMIVNKADRLALTENERLTPWDDEWHNVLVRRNIETGAIDIYFDNMDEPHMSVIDKTFGAGRVGIGSFDDLNEFDDLTVSTF